MARKTAIWGPPQSLDRAWPEVVSAGDPDAGDELLFDPSPYDDYCSRVPDRPLDADSYAQWDRTFHLKYTEVLGGLSPWTAPDEAAAQLGVDGPIKLDRRPIKSAWTTLADPALCDFGEDWIPDMALHLARVLGPFAHVNPPARAKIAAGAVMAFAPLLYPRVRAVARGMRNHPKPPAELRQAMTALLLAPGMIYEIRGDRLVPLLLQGARICPEAPLESVPTAPVVVCRALPADRGGTWLAAALPLPGAPPADMLMRRLTLEYRRMRRHERRLTLEDMLRDRPEVLYRTACEWWFEHDPDAVLACWADPASWPQIPAPAGDAPAAHPERPLALSSESPAPSSAAPSSAAVETTRSP